MKTPNLVRTLAIFALGSALVLSSAPRAAAVAVTFQVNMEIQAILGTFNAGAGHTVEVHGSFDGWGPGFALSPSAGTPGVYEGTTEIAGGSGTQVQYKFVINQSGSLIWESDGVGPGGANNRAFNLPASAQTLPVVYFNNQSTPPGVVAVTFQINMSVQRSLGNFDPALGHTVEVHGSFDGWGAGAMLTVNAANANLYEGTVSVNGSAGAPYEHKFVMNQGGGTLTWEGNVGSGGPFGNRTFNLGTSPQTLPVVYFNNLTNDPGAGIPVTFRVSLEVPIARGMFDPTSGTVVVAGQFNNWSTSASPLTNTPANPYLYTGIININSVPAGGSVAHKFVLNGGTWETGDNRAFTLESPSQTLPIEYFDRVPNLGPVNIAKVEPFFFQFTVSWTGGPLIRLQSAPAVGGPWTDVPNTLGQSSALIDHAFEEEVPPAFFRIIAP
jgi:hypothetical protein